MSAADDAGGGRGGRGEGGPEGDKSHSHLPLRHPTTPTAAQDLQHFSNQSSEQFDGGGGGGGLGVHPTREHEGHGLEVSLHLYALFSCICTVVFGRFLKDVGGGENVRKE